MTERIRQSLGGLCIALVLLVGGLLLRPVVEALGAVLLTGALLLGLVSLANLGLDLMQGDKASD